MVPPGGECALTGLSLWRARGIFAVRLPHDGAHAALWWVVAVTSLRKDTAHTPCHAPVIVPASLIMAQNHLQNGNCRYGVQRSYRTVVRSRM